MSRAMTSEGCFVDVTVVPKEAMVLKVIVVTRDLMSFLKKQ
jgi:hypothetical protein